MNSTAPPLARQTTRKAAIDQFVSQFPSVELRREEGKVILRGDDIDDAKLVTILNKNRWVTDLVLVATGVLGTGWGRLDRRVKLHSIWARGGKITNEGFCNIAQISSLRELDISRCESIDDSAKQIVAELRPDLHVEDEVRVTVPPPRVRGSQKAVEVEELELLPHVEPDAEAIVLARIGSA